jgi:N-acylneuraminate cytidylyltransferase
MVFIQNYYYIKGKMNNLCIIPARGGSKRIPRKNIKEFIGKPIIAYSIEVAIKSKLFLEVMVSTDDEEIAEIAKQYGAKVPFKRSAKNSNDQATTPDVMNEVLGNYKKEGKLFSLACCIYPTAPLISIQRLKEAYELLINENFDSIIPVIHFDSPIQRAFKIDSGKLKMMWPENIAIRSQDLEPAYHDCGQFYWFKVNKFFETKQILTNNTGAIQLNEMEMQDIDEESHWKIAEIKYTLRNRKIDKS